MGYGDNVRGYRLYDQVNRKIVKSRDVIFLEDEKSSKNEHLLIVNEAEHSVKVESMEGSDPKTYSEARSCIDANKWKEAMDAEYESLLENETTDSE